MRKRKPPVLYAVPAAIIICTVILIACICSLVSRDGMQILCNGTYVTADVLYYTEAEGSADSAAVHTAQKNISGPAEQYDNDGTFVIYGSTTDELLNYYHHAVSVRHLHIAHIQYVINGRTYTGVCAAAIPFTPETMPIMADPDDPARYILFSDYSLSILCIIMLTAADIIMINFAFTLRDRRNRLKQYEQN